MYVLLMTNSCFGCIVVVSNSFISTKSLTVVLYSSAIFQRLSPFSTSYVSADAVVMLAPARSEEHTSELQSRFDLVCRLLLEKKKTKNKVNNLGITTGTYMST